MDFFSKAVNAGLIAAGVICAIIYLIRIEDEQTFIHSLSSGKPLAPSSNPIFQTMGASSAPRSSEEASSIKQDAFESLIQYTEKEMRRRQSLFETLIEDIESAKSSHGAIESSVYASIGNCNLKNAIGGPIDERYIVWESNQKMFIVPAAYANEASVYSIASEFIDTPLDAKRFIHVRLMTHGDRRVLVGYDHGSLYYKEDGKWSRYDACTPDPFESTISIYRKYMEWSFF